MQSKSSIKTLLPPFSAQFSRHCVLSGGTKRHALPKRRNENIKLNQIKSASWCIPHTEGKAERT